MSYWQLIFTQSKVNGCLYEDKPPEHPWHWPQKTWLQQRLRYVRETRCQAHKRAR